MKKTLLHGAFKTSNYGDFLFYKIYKDYISQYNQICFKKIGNFIETDLKASNELHISSIKEVDNVIFSSGGYFGEPNSKGIRLLYWRLRMVFRHVRLARLCKYYKKPYMIVGIGVGPINFSLGRKMVKDVFQNAKYVSVRDQESLGFLNSIDVSTESIKELSDAVIYKAGELLKFPRKINKNDYLLPGTSKILLYHLTGSGHLLDKTTKAIKEFYKINKEYTIVLCTDLENKSQSESITKTIEKFTEHPYIVFDYNPYDFTHLINFADVIITHKLHVGIVGASLTKSVISIPTHNKTLRFYKQINESDRCIDNEVTVDKIVSTITRYKNIPIIIPQDIIDKSKANFDLINKFLKEY